LMAVGVVAPCSSWAAEGLAEVRFKQVVGGTPELGEKVAVRMVFFEPPVLGRARRLIGVRRAIGRTVSRRCGWRMSCLMSVTRSW
jgi:hypothetical protein